MKSVKRLLSKVASIPRYMRISGSIDFMWRYLALALLYTINAFMGWSLGKVVSKAHALFHKPFIFKTPFWTFLGSTVNHWTVLIPDYESEIQEVITQNVHKTKHQSEKVFLNIWSHIGRFAIELSKKHGYTSYCFEPSPKTFETLKINSILSHVEDKMHLYNFCLGDKDGETLFEYVKENDASSKMVVSEGHHDREHHKGNFITVPVKVYDHLDLGIKPDLIIMDVEGFEFEVLKGMQNLLTSLDKTDVIIEIMHHTPTKKETLELMKAYGFTQHKWVDDHDCHFWKE